MDNDPKADQPGASATPEPSEEEQSLHSTEPVEESVVKESSAAEPVAETDETPAESTPERAAAPVVPVDELNEETEEHEGPRWLILGSLVVLAIAVGVGLFFGVRTIYRSAHHTPGVTVQSAGNKSPQAPPTTSGAAGPSRAAGNATAPNPTPPNPNPPNPTPPPAASSNSAANNATSSNRSPAGSTNTSANNSTAANNAANTSANNTTAAGKPIPNTGPGDVIALFVGAALIASGIHYVLQARKSTH